MIGKIVRIAVGIALLVALAWIVQVQKVSGQVNALPSTKNGEWPMYTADLRGSKYSPLDQIDATNFNKLQVAWTFRTDNLGPRPEAKLEGTPIMVKGILYATGGTRRAVVALDAKTGEQKWVYSMDEGARAEAAPRRLSGAHMTSRPAGKLARY
jgi:glucose dehydrogenase